MPKQDLKIETPGLVPAEPVDDTPTDGKDTRIAELEATVALLNGTIDDLREQLRVVQTVPSRIEGAETAPRIIGPDWSGKTSAEARAAGVIKPVLCSDGYYVP